MGYKGIAELLLASKADVDAKDNEGLTPLNLAVFRWHPVVVELLLTNKADVNVKDNNGETPLGRVLAHKDTPPSASRWLAGHSFYEAVDANEVMAEFLRNHGGHE